MLLIRELKLKVNEDESILKELISKKLRTSNFTYTIYKKSLDSRREPMYIYTVKVVIENEDQYLKIKNVSKFQVNSTNVKKVQTDIRPIIIGYGPSGIFSALRLFEAGIKPIVFEKGKRIKERSKDVRDFFNGGQFNANSNVQFGEGGAGTFSDAKLTTRIKDPFIEYILNTFVKYGADRSILINSHAHIGTDKIQAIITRITNHLIENGVEFHFEEEVKSLIVVNREFKGVKTNKGSYYSDYCLLGIGHSSYDLIKSLYFQGVYTEAKDMAIGFRVEHPQTLINYIQRNGCNSDKLEPSEYFLRYQDERNVYSFCMCPGGFVIPANSEPNTIVTNGMSYHSRDNVLANSAILIQVNKDEFEKDALSGFDYLHEIEQKSYDVSGSYKALSQNIKDYINNETNELKFNSSYPLGTTLYNFNNLFTPEQNKVFKKALKFFNTKMPGFLDGIMVGPETRSSSPVRIKRDMNYQSISTKGLYPMGEGAGYGGGIMSCSLDGIRIANRIIDILSQKSHK